MKEALTRKLGPLPTWMWVAVIVLVVVGVAWWKGRQNQAASNSAVSNATPPPINQFQFVPPVQEDEDNEDTDPDRHHRKHRKRKHPTHHPRDMDDGKRGGGGTGPPIRRTRPPSTSGRPVRV